MDKNLEEILTRIYQLPQAQQMELLKILEKRLATPLQNPQDFLGDLDNQEVDKACGPGEYRPNEVSIGPEGEKKCNSVQKMS